MSITQSGSAELSKEASKGRFAGTYVKPDGSAELFYLTEDGVYGYNFSANGIFTGEATGSEVMKDLLNMQTAESQTSEMKNLPVFKGDVIMGSNTWTGNLVVKTGELYLRTSDKFIYGPDFEEKETIKPKVDETWMSKQIGYRSYSPYKKVILSDGKGKQMLFEFVESGKFVVAPSDGGSIQGAGVVVEKVSIKNPSPNGQNTLAIFSIPGNDPNSMNTNVIVTPYSMGGMGAGNTSSGGFAIMVMPINAPSTYKPHKRLVPPEDKRINLFVYRLNKENQVVDSVNFHSSASAVNFQYICDEESKTDAIFGFGNDKKTKWRWGFAAMDLNIMQFIKLNEKGQIDFHKTYLEDEIADKIIVPGAKNNKVDMKMPDSPVWEWFKKLDNGNYLFYGQSRYTEMAFLTDENGDLIHFYLMPVYDASSNLGTQVKIRGNDIYLAAYYQPYDLTNTVQSETSTTPYSITTKTTQLFEIYHMTKLVKIEGNTGDVQQIELGEGGKKYYTMHNQPVIFAEDAIYVPGRAKAPKGKEIFLEKVSY
ncbi:MAG TPA: hypothetical protein VIN10_14240 [Bacteroidales bacterium]